MLSQVQSPIFAKLPLEIRLQIQVEYLAEYLRVAAAQQSREVWWAPPSALDEPRRFSTSPSPLSLSCKRMHHEMRQDSGPVVAATAAGLAVFCVTPKINFPGVHCGLAAGARFQWERLRRLRFINELDMPESNIWPELLTHLLPLAPNLSELEMEFSPKMSFIRSTSDKQMKLITDVAGHPSIRHIRLRGNVPSIWVKKLAGVVGKEVAVEPVLWRGRDPEAEAEMERQRSAAAEWQKKRADAFYARMSEKEEARVAKETKRREASNGCLKCSVL